MPTTKKTGGRKKARTAKQKAATKKLVAMNRARAKGHTGGNRKTRRAAASKGRSHAKKPAARKKASHKGRSRSMRGVDGVGLGDVGDVGDSGEGLQAVGVGRSRRKAKRKTARKTTRKTTHHRKPARRKSHSMRGVGSTEEIGLGKGSSPLLRAIRATGHTQKGVIDALLRGGAIKTEHKKPAKKHKRPVSRIVQIARMNNTTVADVEQKIAACGLNINPRKPRASKAPAAGYDQSGYSTSGESVAGVSGPLFGDRFENPVPMAMGIKEAVIGAVVGGLFFTIVDLGDRYLATMKPKGQKVPVVGQQALSAIESPPGALRLGVQGGVALLGGVAAYALRGKSPKAAAAMIGVAAAAGTHAVWQLLSSRAMPALLKAQSPNDATVGNRLYPDYQAYMVAANKLAALAPASPQPDPTNNPLPLSAMGVGNPARQLGPVTAGYPASYRAPGLGQVGVDCGCAGGGSGASRARHYASGDIARGMAPGYGASDNLMLQDGLWWDMGLGRPATGAQLQAMMARRAGKDASGESRPVGMGAMAQPQAKQMRDAQGNLWVQLSPGTAPYLAEEAGLDCGGNREYAIDENGKIVAVFNPDQAAMDAAEQDLIRAGYQPMASSATSADLAMTAAQHAMDATAQAQGAQAAQASGNSAAASNLAAGAADSANKAASAASASGSSPAVAGHVANTAALLASVQNALATGNVPAAVQAASSAANSASQASAAAAPGANPNITPEQLAANLANARPSPSMAQHRTGRKALTPSQRRMKMLSGVKMDDADIN